MPSPIAALFSIPCHRHIDGHLAFGKLSLANDRLCFESQAIETEWIPFHSILGVEAAGQTLTILTRTGLARYHSKDASLLDFCSQLRRLKKVVIPTETPLQTQFLFEKATVSSSTERDQCGVFLNIERLRIFHNKEGLSADIPLSDLQISKIKNNCLEIQYRDVCRRIHGVCARRIIAYLTAMEHLKGPPFRPIIQSWQVVVKKSLFAYTALAVLSDKSLIIHPLQWMDFYAPILHLMLDDVAELQFETHSLSIRLRDQSKFKLIWDESSIKLGRRVGIRLTQTPIDSEVPTKIEKDAKICGAATLWLPNRIVRRGYLSATSENLNFADLGENKPSLTIPIKSICRDDDSDTRLGTLPLRSGQQQISFHPEEGESFVHRFYSIIKPPHRRIDWKSLSDAMRSAWLNEAAAHIQSEKNGTMSALILYTSNRIVLQPLAGDTFEKRDDIQIEFHTQQGRMRFQSRLISTQQGGAVRLEIEEPSHLELISQRAIARIMVDGWVEAISLSMNSNNEELLPSGQAFSLEMRNISERGCGLSGTKHLKAGDRLLLGLDCLDPTLHIQAECVYIHEMGPQSRWRKKNEQLFFYGFQFVLQTMGMRRRMNRLIDDLRKAKQTNQ